MRAGEGEGVSDCDCDCARVEAASRRGSSSGGGGGKEDGRTAGASVGAAGWGGCVYIRSGRDSERGLVLERHQAPAAAAAPATPPFGGRPGLASIMGAR